LLRERVFSNKEYRAPFGNEDFKPATIDELLAECAEEGSASILDCSELSDEYEMCKAAPVPLEDIKNGFGTDKPTREQVESTIFDILEDADLERGAGAYVTCYKDGNPSEICFAGWSFD